MGLYSQWDNLEIDVNLSFPSCNVFHLLNQRD